VRGCKIEWGSEIAKMSHFAPHLKLSSEFVTNGGLILDISIEVDRISNFKRMLLSFKRCYLDNNESMKREILKRMYQYIV